MHNIRYFILLVLFHPTFIGCAYTIGYRHQQLVGKYDKVSIPMFSNISKVTGAETFFTKSLIREVKRTKVITVTETGEAPVTIRGTILALDNDGLSPIQGGASPFDRLPTESALFSVYRVRAIVRLEVIKNSSKEVLWAETFTREKLYNSSQVESAVINSANALYNQSALRNSAEEIANALMVEVYDRLTENF